MKRSVGVAALIIGLLSIAFVFIFWQQSTTLSDTENTLDAQVAAAAAAQTMAAVTQTAQEGEFFLQLTEVDTRDKQIGHLQATTTQQSVALTTADANAAQDQAAAAATQSALEDDLATQRAGFGTHVAAAATQQNNVLATSDANAAATQAVLKNDLATQQAQAAAQGEQVNQLEATVTRQADLRVTASVINEDQAATMQAQENQIATLSAPMVFTDQPVADVAVGELFFRETFDSNDTENSMIKWPEERDEYGVMEFADGQYVFAVSVDAYLEAPNFPIISDDYMEVEVFLGDCPEDGFVGAGFRLQADDLSGYNLYISCDLKFWALSLYEPNAEPNILAQNAFTLPNLDLDQPHTIGIVGDGARLSMYLDRVLLGSMTDDTYREGMISLYGSAGAEKAVIRFDNLRIWHLAEPSAFAPAAVSPTPLPTRSATATNAPRPTATSEDSPAAGVPSAASVLYAEAMLALIDNDYQAAVDKFTQAIELAPNYIDAYEGRAHTYLIGGEYDRALADLNVVIENEADNASAYYTRAEIYRLQFSYRKALGDYNRAIQYDPELAEAYHGRGLVYDLLGNRAKALADFTRALELRPDFVAAYCERGWIYMDDGAYMQAKADLDRALELDPDNAWAYQNRGWVLYNLELYEEALADYDRAIELDPAEAWTYNDRGMAYEMLSEFDQALADYNRAIELDSTKPIFFYNRGKFYGWVMGDYEKALADLRIHLELAGYDAAPGARTMISVFEAALKSGTPAPTPTPVE